MKLYIETSKVVPVLNVSVNPTDGSREVDVSDDMADSLLRSQKQANYLRDMLEALMRAE